MDESLFKLPQLAQVEELELTVFTALEGSLYEDILEWMQEKPVKLVILTSWMWKIQ